jgi:hypothetical protein
VKKFWKSLLILESISTIFEKFVSFIFLFSFIQISPKFINYTSFKFEFFPNFITFQIPILFSNLPISIFQISFLISKSLNIFSISFLNSNHFLFYKIKSSPSILKLIQWPKFNSSIYKLSHFLLLQHTLKDIKVLNSQVSLLSILVKIPPLLLNWPIVILWGFIIVSAQPCVISLQEVFYFVSFFSSFIIGNL